LKTAAIEIAPLDNPHMVLGKAPIVRALFEGKDMTLTWQQLFERVEKDPSDAAAFLDLSILLHTLGREQDAVVSQKAALETSRTFQIRNGRGDGLRVLVLLTAGDFMANTPIEFLLESSHTTILLHYVDAETQDLDDVPDHDVAFVAVSESPENLPVLENLDRLLSGWTGPILNNAPRRIMKLSRDAVAEVLKNEASLFAPPTVRASRNLLERLASEEIGIGAILGETSAYPLIVRPIGSHAGKGMEKIAAAPELAAYLATRQETEFYLAPYVDYSGGDGKFRKQRIAFINGRAYASHFAVSDHWMVHYMSAGMAESQERRAEEAAWMARFDDDFAARHARAFDALHRHLGLDYFAIDCAELPDGRLLLFEADVAMIVHSMDPVGTFPYKKAAMSKLFLAFERALQQRVNRTDAATTVKCAHTGKAAVHQRNDNDCLICALAMYLGRSYEDIQALARDCDPAFPLGGPMSHSIMRGVANKCGFVLLSGIYMLWSKPAIIGVTSPTIPNAGHAVFWDGEKIIDPGFCERVDRSYIDRWGLEFTQRASDLEPLIVHEIQTAHQATAATVGEPF